MQELSAGDRDRVVLIRTAVTLWRGRRTILPEGSRDRLSPGRARELEETGAVWKEERYTSRSEFLRHAIRDATEHPGASRSMLASIAAEEHATATLTDSPAQQEVTRAAV